MSQEVKRCFRNISTHSKEIRSGIVVENIKNLFFFLQWLHLSTTFVPPHADLPFLESTKVSPLDSSKVFSLFIPPNLLRITCPVKLLK